MERPVCSVKKRLAAAPPLRNGTGWNAMRCARKTLSGPTRRLPLISRPIQKKKKKNKQTNKSENFETRKMKNSSTDSRLSAKFCFGSANNCLCWYERPRSGQHLRTAVHSITKAVQRGKWLRQTRRRPMEISTTQVGPGYDEWKFCLFSATGRSLGYRKSKAGQTWSAFLLWTRYSRERGRGAVRGNSLTIGGRKVWRS